MWHLFVINPPRQRKNDSDQQGMIMVIVLSFLVIVSMFSVVVLAIASETLQVIRNQELIRQVQLASVSAMDYAKEQYELDQNYSGTAETTLYETNLHRITYEVVSRGYTNPSQTQQDIQGIGRIYNKKTNALLYIRDIQGKVTYSAGVQQSARFIFIIDNSGSMSTSEWLQSKETVDDSIEYIINNAPTAQVAVVQYGTNHYNQVHKYNVTVPFTRDIVTATNWDRYYGQGSPNPSDYQDHLPASLYAMRQDSVYGPGDLLDLQGATNVQYVLFTDARGEASSGGCCSSLKRATSEPSSWNTQNVLLGYGEYNVLKDGTVFEDDGYPGLTASWTVLSINPTGSTPAISAAIASVGGQWTGAIDNNPGDPEGNGILPRRFILTSLSAGPAQIISLLQEILEAEINI